ncbi:RNA-guided endonuclease InsQ/TnpB family protein [Methanolobus bombayensis]|uniref:RNA-guided endonuclease InsQ/TnpB family protein n=1 Tax=Methanolobus bombayensis TaxID=38023 RepID=UPI001AE7D176|nr:RNA-guided endonuclease TnpB family protein [Methanolobus bombayensis]MBP1910060.1 putative transposase [Methanolobus bombayensis]
MVRKEGQNCRNLRFLIHPNPEQEVKMEETLETCRKLWNDLLSTRINLYDIYGLYPDSQMLEKQLKFFDYANNIHSQVRLNVFERVQQAYFKFLDDIKNGRLKGSKPRKGTFVKRKDVPAANPPYSLLGKKSSKPIKYDGLLRKGHPRFKGKEDYYSFTYKQHGNGWELRGNNLFLSKITDKNNLIKIDVNNDILNGQLKTCTIKKEGKKWFAFITIELPDYPEPIIPQTMVGIDLGLNNLIATSDGEFIEPPKLLRNAEKRLAVEQRKLSNMEYGSQNYLKQKRKVNRIHRNVKGTRNHISHCLSKLLVAKYDLIVFEDLKIKNMVKVRSYAKSIHDAAWGRLVLHVMYKAAEIGKITEKVNPKNTSQTCSACGKKKKVFLKKGERRFHCEHCDLKIDRDVNAAINILLRSKTYTNTVGLTGIYGCGVGTSTSSCKAGLQVPTMNQQLLNLMQG